MMYYKKSITKEGSNGGITTWYRKIISSKMAEVSSYQ